MLAVPRAEETMLYAIGGGLIGWMLSLLAKAKRVSGPGGHPYPTPKDKDVPFASGPAKPVWPIGPASDNSRRFEVAYHDVSGERHGNSSRAFKASRGSGSRYHAGIDLYADAGDIVLAPESGTIVSEQNFLGTIAGKDAIMIQGDSGTVLLLGEIVAGSYADFGLSIGSHVSAGQPVAKIGLTSNGSHMLHFETYTRGTKKNWSWKKTKQLSPTLRDPTGYLLRARATTGQPFPD